MQRPFFLSQNIKEKKKKVYELEVIQVLLSTFLFKKRSNILFLIKKEKKEKKKKK